MDPKTLVKVTLDTLSYDAAPEVANALQKATAELQKKSLELDGLAGKVSSLTAERDAEKVRADKAEKALKDEQDSFDAKVKEAAITRAAVLEKAKAVLTDKELLALDGQDLLAVKRAVISKFDADQKDVIQKKEPAYVDAYFDSVVKQVAKRKDAGGQNRNVTHPTAPAYRSRGAEMDSGETFDLDELAKAARLARITAHQNPKGLPVAKT